MFAVKSQECRLSSYHSQHWYTLFNELQIDRTPIVVLVSEPTVELILEFARKHWKFCNYNHLGFATGCWCSAAIVVKSSSKVQVEVWYTQSREN